jgi:hypothetical protein
MKAEKCVKRVRVSEKDRKGDFPKTSEQEKRMKKGVLCVKTFSAAFRPFHDNSTYVKTNGVSFSPNLILTCAL